MDVRYRAYVRDGKIRDDQDATGTANGKPYGGFSVFVHASGKRAAVIVNESKQPIEAEVKFVGDSRSALTCATPERPEARACNGSMTIPSRAAVLVMES